jgi:hypothetical protein
MAAPKDPIKHAEWRARLSTARLGKPSPNKGIPMSDRQKQKISQTRIERGVAKGEKNPMYGVRLTGERNHFFNKHHTDQTKQLQSAIRKQNPSPGRFVKGYIPSPATIDHLSKVRTGLLSMNKNPNWKGGISFEPYCEKFKAVRSRVRAFFNYTCLGCGKPESKNITKTGKQCKLSVHHVRFNKMVCCDDSPVLLAPLCFSCRGKADHDRDGTGINAELERKIIEDYGGKCYLPREAV